MAQQVILTRSESTRSSMQQRTFRITAIVPEEDQLLLYGPNPGYYLIAPVTAAVVVGDVVTYEHLERNVGRWLAPVSHQQSQAPTITGSAVVSAAPRRRMCGTRATRKAAGATGDGGRGRRPRRVTRGDVPWIRRLRRRFSIPSARLLRPWPEPLPSLRPSCSLNCRVWMPRRPTGRRVFLIV